MFKCVLLIDMTRKCVLIRKMCNDHTHYFDSMSLNMTYSSLTNSVYESKHNKNYTVQAMHKLDLPLVTNGLRFVIAIFAYVSYFYCY